MNQQLLMALGIAGGFCAQAAERPEKPNVILLLCDDLGWQDIKCYDIDAPSPMETPNIDALAKQGVLFWQAYSPAPTCAPSRAAILSGTHPARSHMTHVQGGGVVTPFNKEQHRMMPPWYSGRMPLETVTIAEALKANGYTTGHCGKWHVAVNHHAFPQPEDQGFDWTRHDLGVTARMRPHRLTGFATDAPDDPYRLDENGFCTHQNNEDALTFVHENKDKPFFLYYCEWLVHTPIHTRNERLLKKYCDKLGVELPEKPEEWKGEGQTNPFYCAMVEELDYYAGRLFHYLKATDDPRWPGHKLIENTYLIFTSDNGGMERVPGQNITDNYPLDEGKIHVQEGGTRVPLIITGPGIPAGVESEVMVNGLDFYPTILSWTSTQAPEGKQFDGLDISELLKKDPTDPALVKEMDGLVRDTMIWHFPNSVALASSIRIGDYKLIRNYDHVNNPGSPPLELYRLYETKSGKPVRCDIEEAHNLVSDMPEKAQAMNTRLTEILTGMDADYPYYNPHYIHELPNKEKVPTVVSHRKDGNKVEFTFQENGAKVVRANLLYTLNGGDQNEEWFRAPASLLPGMKVCAELPAGTTHYVINLTDENNFLVSWPEMISAQDFEKEKYSVRALSVNGEVSSPASAPVSQASDMFIRLDQNKDAQVTLEEYLGFFMPSAQRKDTNRDGLLTPEEFPYSGSFRIGDADSDGLLTMDEARLIYEKQFRGRDRNKDGIITADEM